MRRTRIVAACVYLTIGLVVSGAMAGCTTDSGVSASSTTMSSGYAADPNSGGSLAIVKDLPPPPDTNGGADQLIAEGDILEVDVFQVTDLNRTVQVDSVGNVSLPLVGAIKAAGKTVSGLQKEIETAYGSKYLQHPDVTVFVKESAGQQVAVNGAVNKAGLYPVAPNATLQQVLAQAGGFSKIADESKVYVFRKFGNRKLVANYDVAQIQRGQRADPRIYGGDTIVAFDSSTKIAGQNLREILGGAASAASVISVIP